MDISDPNPFPEQKEKVLDKWKEALAEFDDHIGFLAECYMVEAITEVRSEMNLLAKDGPLYRFLNCYTYSDQTYSCGDTYGSKSGLLTYLQMDDLKKHMIEFAQKNRGKYCHHKFLASMGEYGICLSDEVPDMSGLLLGDEIDIGRFTERDLYSAEDYLKLVQERKTALELEREKAEADRLAKKERSERETYEKLKLKFEGEK